MREGEMNSREINKNEERVKINQKFVQLRIF